MAGPDPVDIRLLSAVAEAGRAALHEIAARLGMDVREVAARLAALSTTGLPLIVGVECDPNGIRNAVAAANAWNQQYGAYAAQSGGYQVPNPHSGSHPVQGVPSGPHPAQAGPQPYPPAAPPASYGPAQQAPGGPVPAQGPVRQESMNTWGPPGSAAWARADRHRAPDAQPPAQQAARTGKIGGKLDVEGPEGERITIQLVEVVDPADFLFTAAGYQLQEGERAVVVHTELTNRGTTAFTSLPDLYLELVAVDGSTISKAPVSLSSRPPHRIGVPPGETAGGHTVYVLPEATELASVRWTPRPGDDQRTLLWDVTDS